MEYNEKILEKLELVNKALSELNLSNLFESPYFVLDEMSMNSWLRFKPKESAKSSVPIYITFTPSSLEIGIDKIVEALDWSNDELETSSSNIIQLIKDLFNSYILIEYYGASKTYISIFSIDGTFIRTLKYREGVSFRESKSMRLFLPFWLIKEMS